MVRVGVLVGVVLALLGMPGCEGAGERDDGKAVAAASAQSDGSSRAGELQELAESTRQLHRRLRRRAAASPAEFFEMESDYAALAKRFADGEWDADVNQDAGDVAGMLKKIGYTVASGRLELSRYRVRQHVERLSADHATLRDQVLAGTALVECETLLSGAPNARAELRGELQLLRTLIALPLPWSRRQEGARDVVADLNAIAQAATGLQSDIKSESARYPSLGPAARIESAQRARVPLEHRLRAIEQAIAEVRQHIAAMRAAGSLVRPATQPLLDEAEESIAVSRSGLHPMGPK